MARIRTIKFTYKRTAQALRWRSTSNRDGSEVLYTIEQGFTPPNSAGLEALATGLSGLPSVPGGLALDYVRETINGAAMVTRAGMALLPITTPAGNAANALQNAVIDLLNQAVEPKPPSGCVAGRGLWRVGGNLP